MINKGTVLVTGSSGFTGTYLRAALVRAGYRAIGLTATPLNGGDDVCADLTEPKELSDAIARASPRFVVHLAAISFVAHADADQFYRVNVLGTENLLRACATVAKLDKVILASSANVYGRAAVQPVHEDLCPAPVNHYGASKLAMEHIARTWFDRLPILITRPFNYTGVGQDARFVIPKMVKHFRERSPLLELGDVNVTRDFADVRDVAEIYVRLLESAATCDAVNICSGRDIALNTVLDDLAEIAGYRPKIATSEALMRSAEIPRLVGSVDKLARLAGGCPDRPFRETLSWMMQSS